MATTVDIVPVDLLIFTAPASVALPGVEYAYFGSPVPIVADLNDDPICCVDPVDESDIRSTRTTRRSHACFRERTQ